MTNIATFTGGKRCRECDEQIAPKRVQAQPDAQLCTSCQQQRDMAMAKAVNRVHECGRGREIAVQNRASVTIKW